ncbi:MAG: UPF0182 family protein [Clostridia bacterium]|nr:UPF0182 family protein [Clostridia bacterium]
MNNNPFDIFGSFMNGATGESGENKSGAESEMARRWKQQNGKKEGKPMSKKKKILLIVLACLVAVFLLSDRILRFVMDIWHVSEIGAGYTDIFWKNVLCRLAVFGAGFLLVFVVTLINSFLLRRLAFCKHLEGKVWEKRWPYLLFSLVFSLIFGGIMGENTYQELLAALHATDFGVVDPMFGKDIGYYIFVRPFLQHITGALKSIFMLQALLVALAYFVILSISGIRKIRDMIQTQTGAVSHVLVNVLLCYLAMFFSYRFTAEDLMYGTFGGNGAIAGAGFIEFNIWKPYYAAAPWLVLAAIVFAAIFLYRKKLIATLISVGAVPVVYGVVVVVSIITQQFVVAPDERNHQTPYIKYNMEATKQAFGLDNIREVQFDFGKPLTDEIITENKEELLNTRIIDFNASLTAYNQLQYFRKYYTFNDIDVVPYEIDGNKTGVFLSARELNKDNLEDSARSYTNEKFRYTHGFGLVASPFNRVTEDGQPHFSVRDIPPKSENGMPEVTQPRIYYGESTNDYVIVGSNNKELDYSEGYTDVEYTFEGDTGVKMSFFKKLLFSIYYRDYKMFFSGNIDSDSKILINRNVLERVQKVAPFFMYEKDPCIVLGDDGKLMWMIDGYTYSDRYPYAQNYGGANYIRNSVKVLVDAYTGDVTFYIIDPDDPMVQTYSKIYPSLFSKEPLPETLKNHITVPEGLFKLQSEVYQKYHLDDAGQFYDQSDVWRISTEKYHNDEVVVSPYFNMFTVEGEENPELVLTIPYVLGDKYNMVGILMQRSEPAHYGELVLYRIPKSNTVYGPMQIENKIDNDPDISREMTLWGQGGSTVIRGNLLVIPFENSIFYVEPVYITSENNASLPEMKRIIVAYKDAVAMAPTLEEALSQVLEASDGLNGDTLSENESVQEENTGEETQTNVPSQPDVQEKIQKVLDAYDAFRASGNDWSTAGENLEHLGEAIEALR